MNLDALLHHYFGVDDVSAVAPGEIGPGIDRITLDFAIEREPGRRFALWALMLVLGHAPAPEKAFKTPAEQSAAREFATLFRMAAQQADGTTG